MTEIKDGAPQTTGTQFTYVVGSGIRVGCDSNGQFHISVNTLGRQPDQYGNVVAYPTMGQVIEMFCALERIKATMYPRADAMLKARESK